jgi:hypothetical protein
MTIRSAAEFARLPGSDEPSQYARAAHEDAPVDVWQSVIDDYPHLRRWVAHNKTVPVEVLRRLSADADPEVRWMVACKRKLPQDLIEVLSRDSDEDVRARVVRHPRIHESVLQRLAGDSSAVIRAVARERLNTGEQSTP